MRKRKPTTETVNQTPETVSLTASDARDWERPFLEALRNSGNVRASCQLLGISRTIAYRRRDESEEFSAAWDEAMDDAIDSLEAAARQRAMKGSDLLMMFLLKAHRPEKYRETQKHEISGPEGGPVQVMPVAVDYRQAIVPMAPSEE